MSAKPGRNDPCPCGSGKKYKQCCLGSAAQAGTSRTELPAQLPQLLRNAATMLRLGQTSQAEGLLRQILNHSPRQADALNLLGTLQLRSGNVEEAVELFKKAVASIPNNPEFQSNLGFAYHEQGQLALAASHYRKALELHPRYVNALYNRHALQIDDGQLDKAIQSLHQVLEINPRDHEARYMIGVLSHVVGDMQAAAEHLAKLDEGSPKDRARVDAWRYLHSAAPALPPICGSMWKTFERSIKAAPPSGLVLEFGVRHGNTIRQIAKLAEQHVHGFDSFEGLPEDWHHEAKGSYSTNGVLPAVPSNVTLHPGWFHETLPPFLEKHPGPARLINIDCDIYSSTKTVLDLLAPRIVPGTLIIFDEYIGNEHWREDEYKAFQEAVAHYGWKYEYTCFSVFTKQVAIRIK